MKVINGIMNSGCIINKYDYWRINNWSICLWGKSEKSGFYMPMTSKEMIKLLKINGFDVVSQNGSHIKMKNFDNGKTVIVPYHAKDLKKGMEQAGIQ